MLRYLSRTYKGFSFVLQFGKFFDLLIALLLHLSFLEHTINVPLRETAVGLDLNWVEEKTFSYQIVA